MEATFEDCWTEFKRRSPPRYNETANLLQEEYSENLQHVTSMLDIGAGNISTLKVQRNRFQSVCSVIKTEAKTDAFTR